MIMGTYPAKRTGSAHDPAMAWRGGLSTAAGGRRRVSGGQPAGSDRYFQLGDLADIG
jgi:hypothetical protein